MFVMSSTRPRFVSAWARPEVSVCFSRTLLLSCLLLWLLTVCSTRTQAADFTIITHGFSFGAYPVWVDTMATAMANREGGVGAVSIYRIRIFKDASNELTYETVRESAPPAP